MRITCPHCGQPGRIRTSRKLGAMTTEAYVQCENIDCCFVWKVLIGAVTTIQPSINPRADVLIPASSKQARPGGSDKQLPFCQTYANLSEPD